MTVQRADPLFYQFIITLHAWWNLCCGFQALIGSFRVSRRHTNLVESRSLVESADVAVWRYWIGVRSDLHSDSHSIKNGPGLEGCPGMIKGIGTDIVEIERIRGMLERHGDSFQQRCFTPDEIAYANKYKDPAVRYAGRWAAKEAVVKVLGTGFIKGITFQDIEVLPLHTGQPHIQLSGEAAIRATNQQIETVLITISHAKLYATATAIGT